MEELFGLVLAPFIGSFIGLVTWRLPRGQSVVLGRSHCPRCSETLRAADLIPIFSWLALRGRCRSCNAPIDLLHPGAELGALIVALWAAALAAPGTFWLSCMLGWLLLALSLIDARHRKLPDGLTMPLLALGLGTHAVLLPADLPNALIGTGSGFVLFVAIERAYRRLRNRPGLGRGDAKLLAAGGAWVGWAGLPTVVLIACGIGLVWIGSRAVGGERIGAQTIIAFGPLLAAGIWITWLYGPLPL